MAIKKDLPVVPFSSVKKCEAWFAKNHASPDGIWMRLYKKASEVETVTYAEALDCALCYGWIDGQKKTYDEASWLQKFTPRRPRSMWFKKNIANVERLMKEGRMRPSGQKEIDAAKADGRWARAYDAASTMTVPEDFLAALQKSKKGLAFYETLNKANRYAIAWRLQTAKKPETRQRRLEAILEMMKRGEALH